jgi:hypothetical protein
MISQRCKKVLSVLLFVLCFLCMMANVFAQEEGVVVQVEGSAVIKFGDIVSARETATNDALRNAVKKVVGTLVDSQTQVSNYELIDDSILTKSTGYVTDYEVLDTRENGDTVTVTVRAVVQKGAVIDKLDALKIAVIRAGKPRVMVIIPEYHNKKATNDLAAEAALINGLLAVEFQVVDRDQVTQARSKELLKNVSNDDLNAVCRIAADYDAEILIMGEANSESAGTVGGFISCRARVIVKVIRADTGSILDTYTAQGAGADISEGNASKKALTKAGEVAANYLKSAIPSKLVNLPNSIQVSVSGITFKEYRLLESRLKGTSMVKNVYAREFSDGRARFDVETGSKPSQLADELESFKDLPLEVVSVSGSKIEVKKVK